MSTTGSCTVRKWKNWCLITGKLILGYFVYQNTSYCTANQSGRSAFQGLLDVVVNSRQTSKMSLTVMCQRLPQQLPSWPFFPFDTDLGLRDLWPRRADLYPPFVNSPIIRELGPVNFNEALLFSISLLIYHGLMTRQAFSIKAGQTLWLESGGGCGSQHAIHDGTSIAIYGTMLGE